MVHLSAVRLVFKLRKFDFLVAALQDRGTSVAEESLQHDDRNGFVLNTFTSGIFHVDFIENETLGFL